MEKWRPLLKELTRVSSKLVIVDYASSKSVNAVSGMFFSAKKAVESNTRYFQLHRNEDITQEFLRAGALPAGNYGQFFFPMALHRAMKLQALSKIMEGGARVCGLSFFLGSPVLAAFDMEKGKDKQ
jgi:hypothetical protein